MRHKRRVKRIKRRSRPVFSGVVALLAVPLFVAGLFLIMSERYNKNPAAGEEPLGGGAQGYEEAFAVKILPPAEEAIPQTLPVVAVSLSPKGPEGYVVAGGVYLKNEAGIEEDLTALLAAGSPVLKKESAGPEVLIIHTQTTQGYTKTGEYTYLSNAGDTSADNEKNVVAAGTELARVLSDAGISVLHDKNRYDAGSNPYMASGDAIASYLEIYPTIKVVIDLQRDSIITEDGAKYRPVVDVAGAPAAQIMFIVGTDAGGQEHDNWRDNLKLAAAWQAEIEKSCPGAARPISLRRSRYNQNLSSGALLLCVGSSGNSTEEAVAAARLCARALAKLILE